MCYEENLFRSWAMKKTLKREKDSPIGERARAPVTPIRAEPVPEPKRREVEPEAEEIV
jgi:hypothetical protein